MTTFDTYNMKALKLQWSYDSYIPFWPICTMTWYWTQFRASSMFEYFKNCFAFPPAWSRFWFFQFRSDLTFACVKKCARLTFLYTKNYYWATSLLVFHCCVNNNLCYTLIFYCVPQCIKDTDHSVYLVFVFPQNQYLISPACIHIVFHKQQLAFVNALLSTHQYFPRNRFCTCHFESDPEKPFSDTQRHICVH